MFAELLATVATADDAALLERLRDVEARRREVEAESAAITAELERRGTFRADGHATMWGLLRTTVGWSDRDCRERMRIARLVAAHPDAGELLHDAQASVANVAEIARGFTNERCGDEIESVIGTLLTEACRMQHDDLKVLVRQWERLADVDGAHRDSTARHDRRNAHVVVWNGAGHLAAEFGEADGIANREIFERFCAAEWTADWEATIAAHGDDACTSLMPRTDAQRRADALTSIFAAAASAPKGARRPDPVVNVFVDQTTFVDLLTERRLLPERFVDPFDRTDPLVSARMCRTEHGDPVDPVLAAQIAIDGLVRFVIMDDEGVPIRWGRERRLFTGPARAAVMSLAPRCTHPGCRVRTRRTEADHTVPWARGGRTDPDNGGPKCRRHNLLGNSGYITRRDHRGRWHAYRPDGTEIP